MLKLKNVVKLQAAVRGHLVRRQAVGTLRCVQAIVKMQALVRARRARISSEVSCIETELDGKDAKDDHSSKLSVMISLGQRCIHFSTNLIANTSLLNRIIEFGS